MDKMVDLDELVGLEGKVVMCHGCFDLLHVGHIRHLEKAKEYGDVLVVTVTPDRFVNKGSGRPIFHEDFRMETLAALGCVDYVALNRWKLPINAIELIKPDFYVKGVDYFNAFLPEGNAVIENGGRVMFTDELAFSSTGIINELQRDR